jgi:lysophospholipid acyltransferase (LPLAT)-like uncharacterized protein
MGRTLLHYLVYLYYLLVLKTCRFKLENDIPFAFRDDDFFVVPHMGLVLASLLVDGRPFVLLASSSKDGEIISGILEKRRFKVVRGSSSRRGAAALISLQKWAMQGMGLGLTPDGPKGPPLICKPGLGLLAQKISGSGRRLVILQFSPTPARSWGRWRECWQLNTWDKMFLPKPFQTFCYHTQAIELGEESTNPPEKLLDRVNSYFQTHYQKFR